MNAPPLAPPAPRSLRSGTLAALLFFAAFAVVLAVMVGKGSEGNWLDGPPTFTVRGPEFEVARGAGHRGDGAATLEALDASGTGVLSARVPPFRAEAYARVDVGLRALGPARPTIALLWRTREHPNRVFSKPLQWVDDRAAPLPVGADDGWGGTITGLAVIVRGRAIEPMVLDAVTLPGLSARVAIGELAAQWTRHFPFRAHSNHFPFDEERSQALSLLMATAIAQALAAGGYLLYTRARRIEHDRRVTWAIFLCGWLLLDARWQWNLLRQHRDSASSYAGRSTEEKHLAGADHELYAMMREVRAALPAPPVRIVLLCTNDSLRFRSAYFLYPHSVNGIYAPEPKPEQLRAGDYVLHFLYQRAAYDRDGQALVWAGGARRAVDEVLRVNADLVLLRLR